MAAPWNCPHCKAGLAQLPVENRSTRTTCVQCGISRPELRKNGKTYQQKQVERENNALKKELAVLKKVKARSTDLTSTAAGDADAEEDEEGWKCNLCGTTMDNPMKKTCRKPRCNGKKPCTYAQAVTNTKGKGTGKGTQANVKDKPATSSKDLLADAAEVTNDQQQKHQMPHNPNATNSGVKLLKMSNMSDLAEKKEKGNEDGETEAIEPTVNPSEDQHKLQRDELERELAEAKTATMKGIIQAALDKVPKPPIPSEKTHTEHMKHAAALESHLARRLEFVGAQSKARLAQKSKLAAKVKEFTEQLTEIEESEARAKEDILKETTRFEQAITEARLKAKEETGKAAEATGSQAALTSTKLADVDPNLLKSIFNQDIVLNPKIADLALDIDLFMTTVMTKSIQATANAKQAQAVTPKANSQSSEPEVEDGGDGPDLKAVFDGFMIEEDGEEETAEHNRAVRKAQTTAAASKKELVAKRLLKVSTAERKAKEANDAKIEAAKNAGD